MRDPVIFSGTVAYASDNKNYGATSAPLVVKDKVIVGTSGGDDGVFSRLSCGFDAETGKEIWRFWTIPAPGEPGSEKLARWRCIFAAVAPRGCRDLRSRAKHHLLGHEQSGA
jgi:outer membrane protein assembly factor BamB